MSNMMNPQIVLLREGTEASQGRSQIISNITACLAVVECVRTTLGPRGMDKLMATERRALISNDGATIIQNLNIAHPAAKILADISKSQDEEVGDGTTSVVLLAGEFLREAKQFIENGLHAQTIIKGYRQGLALVLSKLEDLKLQHQIEGLEQHDVLVSLAKTALNSKLIAHEKTFFSEMVVRTVELLGEDLDLGNIGVKLVPGGSVNESQLVEGVAFKKTFAYAGFEQQRKHYQNPKILLLNVELELKAEKENAEVRISDPSQYQAIVDAEWNIIYEKLEKIVQSGAQIVLSKLPIGDLATQYFADRDLFCAGRVKQDDMERVAKATGAKMQSSCNSIPENSLGTCGVYHERQIGSERYNVFSDCASTHTATIIIRGGASQYQEEAERSLHDAIMIVRRCKKNCDYVPGGGAIEMELSRYLRDYSRQVQGKIQLVLNSYARALECIPRALADNCGYDSTDVLNQLRFKHAQGNAEDRWFGVHLNSPEPANMNQHFVWEPVLMKRNALAAATEAAVVVLGVDETVRNPRSQDREDKGVPAMPTRGPGAMM